MIPLWDRRRDEVPTVVSAGYGFGHGRGYVTSGDIRALLVIVARLREQAGDREGAAQARRRYRYAAACPAAKRDRADLFTYWAVQYRRARQAALDAA